MFLFPGPLNCGKLHVSVVMLPLLWIEDGPGLADTNCAWNGPASCTLTLLDSPREPLLAVSDSLSWVPDTMRFGALSDTLRRPSLGNAPERTPPANVASAALPASS